MALDAWQSFNDRISWDGTVHFACEPMTAPLEPAAFTRLQELDSGVLATLGMLGERGSSEPADDETAAAITRVDAKLNVLLEMFNRHLLGHLQLPPRRMVRFNARGVLIEGWTPPGPNAALMVRMHFDGCLGMPLELPGRVAAAPAGSGGFITFDKLDEDIRQSIEHLVFRQHRRQLAESKREAKTPRP